MRELVQAGGVHINLIVVEGDRRLEGVSKELSANHLVSLKIKIITKLDHITRCRLINGHRRDGILHKSNCRFIINSARLKILQHLRDEGSLIFCFHSVLLSFVPDKIQRVSNLAYADAEIAAKPSKLFGVVFCHNFILFGFRQVSKTSIDMLSVTDHTVIHTIEITTDRNCYFFMHSGTPLLLGDQGSVVA